MRLVRMFLAVLFAGSLGMVRAQTAAAPAAPVQAAPPAAAVKAAPPAYEADPQFQAAMLEARKQRAQRQPYFAVDAYKKAIKLSGGQCRRCMNDLYLAQMEAGSTKDAIATANQLIATAPTPMEKSLDESRLGEALLRMGGEKPKPAQLDAAHTALTAALTDYPKNVGARFEDGCVLARMGKMEDASQQFSTCAAGARAGDPATIRAKHFAENPALSLNRMAPAFEVTALDGSRFNLDAMNGKVVLIDFWATWCGPCNAELPHMKKIAKEFAGQPLVIISVSWDADPVKWKEFIQKNEMTWIQYRDADHELSKRFGIDAIPHYFTIDSDGVLTAEMLGEGADVEGKLKKLLKRATVPPASATASAVPAASGAGAEIR